MNVARNSVCIESDVVPKRKSRVSLFILNLQISTKLGKGASFRNLSMTINNENFNVSFCKMVISDILEGVSPKNMSRASSQIPIFRQNTYEKRQLWHTLVFYRHRCVACRHFPDFDLTYKSVPPPLI